MVGATELSVVIAGAIATFFSPCAYALLPGYVGYTVHRTEGHGIERSLGRGLTAGIGVLLVLGAVTGIFVFAGTQLIAGLAIVEPAVGILIAAFGALLILGRGPSLTIPLPGRPDGLLGFGLFGAGYSLAAVGCALPVFVGVVGIAMTAEAGVGALLVAVYVGIVVALMVAVTIAASVGADAALRRFSPHTGTITRIAGVVLLLAGLGQIWVALTISPVGT